MLICEHEDLQVSYNKGFHGKVVKMSSVRGEADIKMVATMKVGSQVRTSGASGIGTNRLGCWTLHYRTLEVQFGCAIWTSGFKN